MVSTSLWSYLKCNGTKEKRIRIRGSKMKLLLIVPLVVFIIWLSEQIKMWGKPPRELVFIDPFFYMRGKK